MTQEPPRLALMSKGSMVGRYRLTRALGRGGHGLVFEAHDTQDAVNVAIKLLEVERSHPGAAPALERFSMEVNAIRRMRHPNVVQVYEFAQITSPSHVLAYYTMEILNGLTLDAHTRAHGAMPAHQALGVVRQAAAGLHRAHSEGIIHRDIKPANIFLTSQGRCVVMDFGVCKLNDLGAGITMVGQVVGTPRYLAPEQLLDGVVDARTDVFALGAVLHFLLTGQHLRPEADLQSTFRAVTSNADIKAVRKLPMPDELKDLLCTALDVQPERRFDNARAFAEALEATQLLLTHEPPLREPTVTEDPAGEDAAGMFNDLTARDARITGPRLPQEPTVPVAPAATAPPPEEQKPAQSFGRPSSAVMPLVLFCPQCGTRLPGGVTLDTHLLVCPATREEAAPTAGPAASTGAAGTTPNPAPPASATPAPPRSQLTWETGTPGGLLGGLVVRCPECGAELENQQELEHHKHLCPGASWRTRAPADVDSLPAMVGRPVAPGTVPAPAPVLVPVSSVELELAEEDAPLELDLSGSGNKARNWTGREMRANHTLVNQHVGNFYSAANRLADPATRQHLAAALDLLAPLSAAVHDHVHTEALFQQCTAAILAVGNRLVEAALVMDSMSGPRRPPVSRLEARVAELTSGKVLQDRELIKAVRGQLDAARAQDKVLQDATGALGRGITALRAVQPLVMDFLETAARRGRADKEAHLVAMLRQIHLAVLGGG